MSILCYHAVERGWTAPLVVTPEAFESHCRWLAANRHVLPLREALRLVDGRGRLPRGTACITFDDGFASVYEHAWPTLRRHGLPAAVFLVAQTLTPQGQQVDWVDEPADHPMVTLTLEQVQEMRAGGIEFGSHSWAHRDLTTLDAQECKQDLHESRELLEDLLGAEVPHLAYPRGRHNPVVRRAAREAGYTHGLALPEAAETPGDLAVPRVGVYYGNGTLTLRAKASRAYLPVRTGPFWRMLRPRQPQRQRGC